MQSHYNAFRFLMEMVQKEGLKFNVHIDYSHISQITAATAPYVNFGVPQNRCLYLYRCGTINLCFAKDCFSKFLTTYINVGQLIHKWESSSNFTACSLSKGPALDYIALLLSLNEKRMLFPELVKNIKVVSEYDAWRNTANIMLEVLREEPFIDLPHSLPFENIEVIQGDPFQELTEKIKNPISNSDVVIMMKTLNLSTSVFDQKAVSKSIQLFIDALKPDAVLFCIDTKISIVEITKVLSMFPGKYLFEPTLMKTNIKLNFKNINHCLPILSGKGYFFVWQKCSVLTSGMEASWNKLTKSVDLLSEKSFDSDLSGPLVQEAISKHAVDAIGSNSFLQSKCNDQQWADDFSHFSQGFFSLSSYSSEDKLQTANFVEEKRDHYITDSINISIDQCTQTENEDLEKIESIGIAELANRIALLTAELSDRLQTNLLNECLNELGSRNSEEAYNSSNDYNHLHPLNMHKCSGSGFQSHLQTCDKFNCSHNHDMCQQGLTPNQHSSNISLNGRNFPAANYCCALQQPESPAEDNSSSPKLVIPLNNLSADVISQIVSLLNQSNPESS